MDRPGGEAILVVRKVFRASAEFLFDAWTDPALLGRWFHAKPSWTAEVIRAEGRVGGAWEIVMRADDGPDCRCFGRYLELDRPRRIVFTWHAGGDPAYETVVSLTLRAIDRDTTELVLAQRGLREERDRAEHRLGWEGCLASLERLALAPRREEERRT